LFDQLPRRIVVAPMAGGPSTPRLVRAAAEAGAVGFLAAGYKTPEAVEAELRELHATGLPYGLNIFVPLPEPADLEPLHRYRRRLQAEADRYEVELPPLRLSDDDHFQSKVELAVAFAPPMVSFAFGIPGRDVVEALRAAGCTVLITVTNADEARRALASAPDAIVAQGAAAGGHASTVDPAGHDPTTTAASVLADVLPVVDIPVVVAGGVGTRADVQFLLAAGATAVQCGTAFLLADEAGTRPAHREALREGARETVVTRAFTGHPARGLRNRFTDAYADAPLGYPAVHHLTAPIRAAAAARGDAEAMNLWAGTAHASARGGTCGQIVESLGG
jgi:nitronate monooxygenase